jgi:CHAD domain-containing protein
MALAAAGRRAQRLALQEAMAALRSRDYTDHWLRFGRWLTGPALSETPASIGVLEYADAVLERLYRKVLKRGRHLMKLEPAGLHELRIRIKKLRYAGEFFASLYPRKRGRALLTALRELQDLLGHANDAAVAERLLQRLIGDGRRRAHVVLAMQYASGLVTGWHSARAQANRPQLAEHWDAFRSARPFWLRD